MKNKIRAIVQEAIEDAGMDVDVVDDLSLIESGLLDSLSIVSVVQSLQREFDIDIEAADITVEVFDSVDALAPFVLSRS